MNTITAGPTEPKFRERPAPPGGATEADKSATPFFDVEDRLFSSYRLFSRPKVALDISIAPRKHPRTQFVWVWGMGWIAHRPPEPLSNPGRPNAAASGRFPPWARSNIGRGIWAQKNSGFILGPIPRPLPENCPHFPLAPRGGARPGAAAGLFRVGQFVGPTRDGQPPDVGPNHRRTNLCLRQCRGAERASITPEPPWTSDLVRIEGGSRGRRTLAQGHHTRQAFEIHAPQPLKCHRQPSRFPLLPSSTQPPLHPSVRLALGSRKRSNPWPLLLFRVCKQP